MTQKEIPSLRWECNMGYLKPEEFLMYSQAVELFNSLKEIAGMTIEEPNDVLKLRAIALSAMDKATQLTIKINGEETWL